MKIDRVILAGCVVVGMVNGFDGALAFTPTQESGRPTTSALSPVAQHATPVSEHDAILLTAARQAAQMVDQGQSARLWDGASIVAKHAVGREQFIQHVSQVRAQLGTVVSRGKGSISRLEYGQGAQVPAGLYVNVSFPTRFAHADQIIRELVSFRLDEDKVWRLAGYHIQEPTQQALSPSLEGRHPQAVHRADQ